jgi:hypothetical protein
MKLILRLALLLPLLAFWGVMLFGQSAPKVDPPKPPAPAAPIVKAPVLPDALIAHFWKSQAQVQTAAQAYQQTPQYKDFEQKQQEFGEVVKELQQTCGPQFQAQMDSHGDPVCAPAPAAKEPVKK